PDRAAGSRTGPAHPADGFPADAQRRLPVRPWPPRPDRSTRRREDRPPGRHHLSRRPRTGLRPAGSGSASGAFPPLPREKACPLLGTATDGAIPYARIPFLRRSCRRERTMNPGRFALLVITPLILGVAAPA